LQIATLPGMNNDLALISLPRGYPPKTILSDPQRVREAVIDYFSLCQLDETARPTPPGLAMAMGFKSFDSMMRAMKLEEDSPGSYPEEAMSVLEVARTYLEDFYIQGGLRESLPKEFVKFLLSSYFARSEKIAADQTKNDTTFTVNILGAENNVQIRLEDL
jgi:hypothetical protein